MVFGDGVIKCRAKILLGAHLFIYCLFLLSSYNSKFSIYIRYLVAHEAINIYYLEHHRGYYPMQLKSMYNMTF